MPEASKFCTCNPHHKGAKVFGSQKRKPNTPIGVDNKTHRLDIVNFSHPRAVKRLKKACAAILPTNATIPEERFPSVHEVSPPSSTGTDICRITAIQKTNVNDKLWHIF